ncbi:MAG TPA: translation factor GTPase family protein [Actinomycetota bacterium]|nr:translation factor GTPase family protein [Actinomycetota bacterium]
MLQRTLNLGILAHVDAGKTTLTERLLYVAGVIDEIGSVDEGSTHTDFLALERQRGITIKSAVVSFPIEDTSVNLIDTPGHPDFIAEVERVLSVLDGAVLVVSAVEGVQSQTPLLMRALKRLRVPTLLFVNKIDRRGAKYDSILHDISDRLTPAIIAMGSVDELGTRAARFVPADADDPGFKTGLASTLAERDEALVAAYIDEGPALSYQRLGEQLAAQTQRTLVHPVFFGSAVTGAGIGALSTGIVQLLPAAEQDFEGPVSGRAFKIERGRVEEKIAYVRMFSGTLRIRDRVQFGHDGEAKVTAISVFDHGSTDPRRSISAGQIGKVWGLNGVQIGDAIGTLPSASEGHHFTLPSLETVVSPRNVHDKGALRVALGQLAEQDPLINVRQDDARHELSVSLYGEVQKEIIQATLANDFGLEVDFRTTTTICIERPDGTGEAVEILREPPNPFLATVGLRVEPAATGSGVAFGLEVELGSMPIAFFRAVETTVRDTLQQGLYGWQVTDCKVTMTHSGYLARHSHAHQRFDKSMSSTGEDFRRLTPLVLMTALQQAGTVVCEPIDRFRLDLPADALGHLVPVLGRLHAAFQAVETEGAWSSIRGHIAASRVHELRQLLPALTRGGGILESIFDRYEPVRGTIPVRPRSDNNPLNRHEYLKRLERGGSRATDALRDGEE